MKKVLVLLMTLVLALGTATTVFAADSGIYAISPSSQTAPYMEVKGSDAKFDIVALKDKANLAPVVLKVLEEAEEKINAAKAVTDLNADLKKMAEDLGYKAEDLAISDFFDITCASGEAGDATIELKKDDFKNFVAMLHFKDGKWQIVKSAKFADGKISFSTKDEGFSPFAIVESTKDAANAPSNWWIWVVIAVVVIAIVVVVILLTKKKKNA